MPTLYIIRGVSGSGKTQFAKKLSGLLNCDYWEADMYFNPPMNNPYNPFTLNEAHTWCFEKFYKDVQNGKDVIISNTSTTENDLKNYIDTAKQDGYDIVSLIVENRHKGKNVNNCPPHKLQRQEEQIKANLKLK